MRLGGWFFPPAKLDESLGGWYSDKTKTVPEGGGKMGEREAGDWLEQADFFILGVLSLLAAFFLACWLRFGDLAVLGSPRK